MQSTETPGMDVIQRNFFRILSSGAFNSQSNIEPMSPFKWRRLMQMVDAQQVIPVFVKGISKHSLDEGLRLPDSIIADIKARMNDNRTLSGKVPEKVKLSSRLLNHRLKGIIHNELHSIDTSIEALDILKLIVSNSQSMLTRGMDLDGIITLGQYLRTRGDKVDFVKLDAWLSSLMLHPMAELQGNILISVFGFDEDELPFVTKYDQKAYKLTLRSVSDLAKDTAQEWHFKQNSAGFVRNNGAVLRRNLRRSLRYVGYAPLETVSNFANNFVRSLSEIEE
ncbi:hypothetical protein HMPREF9138_01315 [Prevotella histicola F0411]|jgi:hypothetical protein|uniref:Uncharacterized protein n=2 Tax=Prevotella histicola TaxID=470565 RepID=G6AGW9_9BACT|nr:hypothetical protein HMPREF9138_01315 [Prevotella histicola F0411]